MIYLVIIIFLTASPALASNTWLVKRVIDGDTIELSTGERVRYIGIDAPEISRVNHLVKELGKKIKARNEALVLHKQVSLIFDVQRKDKYGRLLAYVYVGDTFVNAELIREGYASASPYPPNTRYASIFKELEREAKEGRRGLWGCLKE